MDSKNNLNFIGGFAGSMKDQETGLDPIPSGADSQHVSGCTPQLEFEVATSMALTEESLYLKVYRLALVIKRFRSDNRNGCEKYNEGSDNLWFIGLNQKGNDVYIKHCEVLREPIAESKCKKKGTKTDKKVVHIER